jgi:hypothetical protein
MVAARRNGGSKEEWWQQGGMVAVKLISEIKTEASLRLLS